MFCMQRQCLCYLRSVDEVHSICSLKQIQTKQRRNIRAAYAYTFQEHTILLRSAVISVGTMTP